MVLPWPWALQNPLVRPWLAVLHVVHFPAHDRTMPFAGELMNTLQPRRDYALHYLALKLPGVTLAGAVLAVAAWVRTRVGSVPWIAAAAGVPLLLVAILNPVLYDGLRHLLFVVPPLTVVAAWGWVRGLQLWGRRWWLVSAVAAGAGAWGLVGQTRAMLDLHPLQYVYFNELAGGLRGAEDRYSLDYYGGSYREAIARLRPLLPAQDSPPTVEAAMPGWAAEEYFGDELTLTRGPALDEPPPMFYVGYRRGRAHEKYADAPVIVRVEREGVTLAVVRDLRRRGRRVR